MRKRAVDGEADGNGLETKTMSASLNETGASAGNEHSGMTDATSGKMDDATTTTTTTTTNENESGSKRNEEGEESDVSLQALLRLRKAQKMRKGGVEFTSSMRNTDSTTSNALTTTTAQKEGDDPLKDIQERFVGQSGQVKDVDIHMIAYVEAEMARRRGIAAAAAAAAENTNIDNGSRHNTETTTTTSRFTPAQRNAASLGKLHEIDLGPSATEANIARTEAAARSLLDPSQSTSTSTSTTNPDQQTTTTTTTTATANQKSKRPFNKRSRRTSTDIARDTLVEQILHETALSTFLPPNSTTTNPTSHNETDPTSNTEQTTDDIVAEQFRRDFIDAIQARRRAPKKVVQPVQGRPGQRVEEVVRGPKLGGSRAARAAMREREGAAAATAAGGVKKR